MKLFKSKEYKYFASKLKGVEYAIMDNQFKRYKTLEIREEIRKEYDNKKAALLATKEGDTEKLKADIKRFEEQIKGLDRDVYGAKPSEENPDGHDGIDQTLESLQELVEMIKDYMTKL